MKPLERWYRAFTIAPAYKKVFNAEPWNDNWNLYTAWQQVQKDLDNPEVTLRCFRDKSIFVGAFAWGYPKKVESIIKSKYRLARSVVTEKLVNAGISPDRKGFYVAEVGTLPQYRQNGLATNSVQTFVAQANESARPLILRTLRESEMANICRRIGLMELNFVDPDDARRILFVRHPR